MCSRSLSNSGAKRPGVLMSPPMKTLYYLLILIFAVPAFAASSDSCWQHEIDPHTRRIYQSNELWQSDLTMWEKRAPPEASYLALTEAYVVYSSEDSFALGLGSDKRAHCYMGCRIAQSVNLETATYVAWLKEDRDIQDCTRSTHFEEADFDATIAGAKMADTAPDAKACAAICKSAF